MPLLITAMCMFAILGGVFLGFAFIGYDCRDLDPDGWKAPARIAGVFLGMTLFFLTLTCIQVQ